MRFHSSSLLRGISISVGAVVFVATLAASCGTTAKTPDSDTPGDASLETVPHDGGDAVVRSERAPVSRSVAESCPSTRLPGLCPTIPAGNCPSGVDCCRTDAECTAGRNGRCIGTDHAQYCGCSYDDCVGDSDCSSETACRCGSVIQVESHDTFVRLPNQCVPSNCRVDSDCASGQCVPSRRILCESTSATLESDSIVAYRCLTSGDQCRADSDCAPLSSGGPFPSFCLYETVGQAWSCQTDTLGCP